MRFAHPCHTGQAIQRRHLGVAADVVLLFDLESLLCLHNPVLPRPRPAPGRTGTAAGLPLAFYCPRARGRESLPTKA
ncbi:hypothetical protein NtRootA9_27900 [Arthrobacter sp. NtRootA9]|nr:hypothetical protein NtRootA9_27900 [Arthrobacter sp. NtRootA9]